MLLLRYWVFIVALVKTLEFLSVYFLFFRGRILLALFPFLVFVFLIILLIILFLIIIVLVISIIVVILLIIIFFLIICPILVVILIVVLIVILIIVGVLVLIVVLILIVLLILIVILVILLVMRIVLLSILVIIILLVIILIVTRIIVLLLIILRDYRWNLRLIILIEIGLLCLPLQVDTFVHLLIKNFIFDRRLINSCHSWKQLIFSPLLILANHFLSYVAIGVNRSKHRKMGERLWKVNLVDLKKLGHNRIEHFGFFKQQLAHDVVCDLVL